MAGGLNPANPAGPAAAAAAAHAFHLQAEVVAVEPFGRGHINDSYRVRCRGASSEAGYLLQRINSVAFPKPRAVMENVARVCHHIAIGARREYPDTWHRRVLRLLPNDDGEPWHVDEMGEWWRCYHYIDGTSARNVVASADEATRAGSSFARYGRQLADLPGERLHESIPRFHDTRYRYDNLIAAADNASGQRLQAAAADLAFFREREVDVDRLHDAQVAGELPERITHNDTKVDNLLFDSVSGEALCVTDLDTTMPGLLAYDYGDLIRTVTSPVPEDHPAPDDVVLQLPLFEAVTYGYLAAVEAIMIDAERRSLLWGAKLMTMEVGMRFLADYLLGDVYFRTAYPEHNLVRSRTQIALVGCIEASWPRLEEAIS